MSDASRRPLYGVSCFLPRCVTDTTKCTTDAAKIKLKLPVVHTQQVALFWLLCSFAGMRRSLLCVLSVVSQGFSAAHFSSSSRRTMALAKHILLSDGNRIPAIGIGTYKCVRKRSGSA